jgi:hypothetical protein
MDLQALRKEAESAKFRYRVAQENFRREKKKLRKYKIKTIKEAESILAKLIKDKREQREKIERLADEVMALLEEIEEDGV